MIPTIGLMIGCYVFTRMVEVLVTHPQPPNHGYIVVKILAGITIVVVLLGIAGLLNSSTSLPTLP
jgi:hypothetical protein